MHVCMYITWNVAQSHQVHFEMLMAMCLSISQASYTGCQRQMDSLIQEMCFLHLVDSLGGYQPELALAWRTKTIFKQPEKEAIFQEQEIGKAAGERNFCLCGQYRHRTRYCSASWGGRCAVAVPAGTTETYLMNCVDCMEIRMQAGPRNLGACLRN